MKIKDLIKELQELPGEANISISVEPNEWETGRKQRYYVASFLEITRAGEEQFVAIAEAELMEIS